MNKKVYRIRQFLMSIMIRVTAPRKQKLIKGNNSLLTVCNLLLQNGTDNVLIATTKGFIKRGTLNPFFQKLKECNIKYTVFTDIVPDPLTQNVYSQVKVYKDNGCKAFVAVGGGSVIDASKLAAALISRPGKSINEMRGLLKINRRLPDIYAAPSTAGTGSEVTAAAVITDIIDGVHYKYAVSDYCLIPRYAVLDPTLTLTLPPDITSYTGMDALTHAVEAYTNLFATPYVKKHALNAVSLIFGNILTAYENPKDLTARENLLTASCEAGIAFTNNFVGYVHALSHSIGALYSIPHGKANAIILPHALDLYGSSIYKKLARLSDSCNINGRDDKEKAIKFIEAVKELNKKMNIPDKTGVIEKKDYDTIIDRALKEANPYYPVPVIWDRKDFITLLERI